MQFQENFGGVHFFYRPIFRVTLIFRLHCSGMAGDPFIVEKGFFGHSSKKERHRGALGFDGIKKYADFSVLELLEVKSSKNAKHPIFTSKMTLGSEKSSKITKKGPKNMPKSFRTHIQS